MGLKRKDNEDDDNDDEADEEGQRKAALSFIRQLFVEIIFQLDSYACLVLVRIILTTSILPYRTEYTYMYEMLVVGTAST